MPPKPSMRFLGSILVICGIINVAFGPLKYVGPAILLAILFVFGWIWGSVFLPRWNRTERLFTGIGLVAAWIATVGGIWIYIGVFDAAAIGALIASLAIPLIVPRLLFTKKNNEEQQHKTVVQIEQQPTTQFGTEEKQALPSIMLLASIIIFIVILIYTILRGATTESILSPWDVVPKNFFIIIFLAIIAVIALIRHTKARIGFFVGLVVLFMLLSITVFVYPIGYGFDPYVHVATERHIAETGTITPKPFSYLGQYALVLFVHHQTGVPIEFIDRLLLPLLLVFCFMYALRRALGNGLGLEKRSAAIAALLLPILPFAQWIVTTPQGLGNAFTFFAASLIIEHSFKPSLAAFIATTAALITHPIAGVPAFILFIFTVLRSLIKWLPRFLRIVLWAPILVGASVALPFLFYLYGKLTDARLFRILPPSEISEHMSAVPLPNIPTHFTFWHDFVYLYGKNILFIIIIAALAAWFIIQKQKRGAGLLIATAVVTMVNALGLLLFIDFSYLPLAEQTGYATRLASVGLLFLTPLVLFSIAKVLNFTDRLGRFLHTGVYALIAGLLVASLYLSYPHHDAYTVEHGWSVGAADIDAARRINQDGGDEPYIVLANQSVSAAALREFGFKKYYDNIFYYSIPTGGPLYRYFHDASYGAPIRETVLAATDQVNANRAYFVVNTYWYRSSKIIERAKLEADEWWDSNDGRVFVFKFGR